MERPLDEEIWNGFCRFQSSAPGGCRIAALIRLPAPEADEREDLWLERAAAARAKGPVGHHTHFGGVAQARPTGAAGGAERVRREAEWLKQHGVTPRFWCGGGWYLTPAIASVLADFGYVDCTATAFPVAYLPPDAPHMRLSRPCWLRVSDGRRLLELPTTHSVGMAARRALSPRPINGLPIHVYFHDWDLLDVRRAAVLRALLTALGRRCRRTDLDRLADHVAADADTRELSLDRGGEQLRLT